MCHLEKEGQTQVILEYTYKPFPTYRQFTSLLRPFSEEVHNIMIINSITIIYYIGKKSKIRKGKIINKKKALKGD